MNNEIWQPVPNFPNYEVSTLGNVRRLTAGGGYKIGDPVNGRLISKRGTGNTSYRIIRFYDGHGNWKDILLGRLVATVFIGEQPAEGYEVDHVNEDSLDNRLENLEWVTRLINNHRSTERNASLSKEQVREIRSLYLKDSSTNIALKYGCSPTMIRMIWSRKRYNWVQD